MGFPTVHGMIILNEHHLFVILGPGSCMTQPHLMNIYFSSFVDPKPIFGWGRKVRQVKTFLVWKHSLSGKYLLYVCSCASVSSLAGAACHESFLAQDQVLGWTGKPLSIDFPMLYDMSIINENPFLLIWVQHRILSGAESGWDQSIFIRYFEISFPWIFQWYATLTLLKHLFLVIFGPGTHFWLRHQKKGGTG